MRSKQRCGILADADRGKPAWRTKTLRRDAGDCVRVGAFLSFQIHANMPQEKQVVLHLWTFGAVESVWELRNRSFSG